MILQSIPYFLHSIMYMLKFICRDIFYILLHLFERIIEIREEINNDYLDSYENIIKGVFLRGRGGVSHDK